MKFKIFGFIFLVTTILANGQMGLKNAPNTLFISSSKVDTFLISTTPVTNREYLIYLMWQVDKQFMDNPDAFFDAFPRLDATKKYQISDEYKRTNKHPYVNDCLFSLCIKNSDSLVKGYIFNPKYIDYPIIGITWLQASRYCKWLSDRYNENTLVKKKYLYWNLNQVAEDCFVTESRLEGQYEGLFNYRIKKAWSTKWSDHIFVPAFRLPTSSEISECQIMANLEVDFKPYPFNKKNLLYQWQKPYMKVNDTSITLHYGYNHEIFKSPPTDWQIQRTKTAELILDLKSPIKNGGLLEIFGLYDLLIKGGIENYTKAIKNSVGQMPFIYIDEDEKRMPIAVENYKNETYAKLDSSKVYIFRFACSMKPKQYVP